MSKICRTCLQKTNETFKLSETLGDFGDGSVRISVVLRFCIRELYLGVSTNPEICFSCKESLKVSYLFKKKCLNTENIIGTFLKSSRSTGKSVELHDVLAYKNDRVKMDTQVVYQQVNPAITVQTHNVVVNWDNQNLSENEAVNKENPQVLEVRQSAPNPTNQGGFINLSSHSHLLIKQCKLVTPSESINQGQDSPQSIEPPKATISVMDEETKFTKDILENTDGSNDFCKISSVFSLNNDAQDVSKNNVDNASSATVNNVQNTPEDIVDIKDEPLDIEMKDEQSNFHCVATDEETLDASETASYENRCNSSLQGFIDNIPEINHPDQYVDIPDFVTINNFGFKELEEFRLQQQVEQANSKDENEISSVLSNSSDLNKTETVLDGTKLLKVFSSIPNVLFVNGKRMVKCGNGYKVEPEPSALITDEKPVIMPKMETVNSLSTTPVRKRIRRKIKIVPVTEPVEKKLKLDVNFPTNEKNIKPPKIEDKEKQDVVVLFTRYTANGIYINDHDYLISPYKRNKVLIEENSEWLCMCYICNTKHHVHQHVEHMKTHGKYCTTCSTDLGTPYMYNIHFKTHKKPCRYCTEVVPYYQLKAHEKIHVDEEASATKVYLGKRMRRKIKKDEKPVYFPISKREEPDLEQSESLSEESIRTEDKPEADNNQSENLETRKKRSRGRPRRKTNEEDVSEIIEQPRALRSRIKKWYAESDDEGSKEESSSSKELRMITDKFDQ